MSPDETEILRTDSLDEVGISSKNLNLKVATGDDFLAPFEERLEHRFTKSLLSDERDPHSPGSPCLNSVPGKP